MTRIRDHSTPFRFADQRTAYGRRKFRLINGARHYAAQRGGRRVTDPPPLSERFYDLLERNVPKAHATILLIAIVAIVGAFTWWA